MLPRSHISPNRDELREFERIDESGHQLSEHRGQGNVVGNDPMAIESIVTTIVSATRGMKKISVLRGL